MMRTSSDRRGGEQSNPSPLIVVVVLSSEKLTRDADFLFSLDDNDRVESNEDYRSLTEDEMNQGM